MSATKAKKTTKGSSSSLSANSTRTVSPKTTPKAAKTLFNYFTKISKDKAENDLNESNRKRKLSTELNQQPPVKILKSSDETLIPHDNSEPAITEPIDIDDDSSCENILPNPVEDKKPLLIKLTPISRKKEAKTKNEKRKSRNAKSEAPLTPAMDVDDVVVLEPTDEENKISIDEKSENEEQSESEAKAVDIFSTVKITKDESALEKAENIEIGAKIDQINDKEEKPEPPNVDANTTRRKSTRIENSQEKATMENQNTVEAVLKKPETKPKKSSARKSTAEVSSKVEKEDNDITKTVGNGSDDKAEIHDNSTENRAELIISENSDGGLSSVISPETNKNKLPHNLNTSVEKKLTEKQIKYHEMRRKAREEREKKIHEEREKRQKEREDQRKKEREEKELKLKKEREEKEEQRKKEKAEKDEQRAKELEQKNEEKRKRDEEKRKRDEDRKKKEAEKEEEKREKEQERLKKEQEKLEEEQKKKREADKFKRFFRNSVDQTNPTAANKDGGSVSISSSQGNESSNPATEISKFMPFCIKGNMKLAPCTRKILTDTQKVELEKILEGETSEKHNSYLKQLKSQKYVIGKSEKTIPNNEDDDVMIVDDELDTIGDEVVELKSKHQKYRAKFLLFNGNRRPPYYGTWRKKSTIVKPCKPFEMDTKYFNYEVDSDDEWEEDEPGESLKGSDDDYESNDDYEVDNEFFVPHGYLSDEENKAEMDGEGEGAETEENDNHPSTQKAKLKILQQEFFAEHNKKTEKIKPKLIGCIWQNLNEDDDNDKYPAIIHKLLENHTMIMDAAIILKPEVMPAEDNQAEISPTSIEFTNEEIQELIKLVHGNVHKRQFLVEEYLASRAEKLEMGKKEKLSKTKISNKIREIAAWKRCVTDNTVMNNRYCWVVAANQLEEFNLSDLGVLNTWKYTLKPLRTVPTSSTAKEDSNEGAAPIATTTTATATTVVNSITKYTTPISKLPQRSDSSTKPIATPSTTITAPKKSPAQLKSSTAGTTISSKPTQPTKKRINPIMSVPRGQAFPQTKKNTLMSEYLKNGKVNNDSSNNNVNNDERKSKITENILNPEAGVADETLSMDCDVIQLD